VDRQSSIDAALVGAIRRGDEESFARLYAAYQGPIFRYALHMCGVGAADDVVQETFLALLRGGKFDGGRGTLAGYLFGIARHHILKRLAVTRLEATGDDDGVIEAATPIRSNTVVVRGSGRPRSRNWSITPTTALAGA